MRVEAQQPFVPDAPVFSHQHANGEVFTAPSIEAARGVCIALAGLSIQEAGLLLELHAMGEQQLADQPDVPRQKPVIKKIQKAQTAQSEPQETIPTVVERATAAVGTEASPKTTEPKTVAAKDAMVVELAERPAPAVEAWQPEAAPAVPEIAQTAGPQPSAHQEDFRPSRSGAEVPFRPAQVFETSITRRELSFDSEQTFAPAPEAAVPKPAEKAAERPLEVILAIDRPVWQPANLAPRIEEVLTDEPAASMLEIDPPAASYEFEYVEPAAEDKGSDAYNLLEADEVLEVTAALEASAVDGSALIPTQTQVEQAASAFALAESVPEFVDAPPTLVAAELPAPAAQVEAAMTELLAALDKSNDAEPAKVDVILTQIVSLAPESDAALAEAPNALEEKLTDLFVELFQEAGVASTPELVASFVRLTRIRYLDALLPVRASALAERHSLPSQIGTREFLQKIQHGLRVATRAIVNFYQIGKSALRLYALPAPILAEA